ncbi:glycosyltransferase [Microbulbifer sp. TRSA002]|uniref:glycosyltransferase n=1 Tax=Microbulbifer sp. TRSA002 TaxID=3243382 RepID=UPI00403A69D1
MKVLICTMQFGHGYTQGTERYVQNLSSELRAQGHVAIIAAGDPEKKLTEGRASKPTTHQIIPTNGWGTVSGHAINYYLNIIDRIQPDLIHMVNPAHIGINILKAAKVRSIPYFISVTDFWWLCPKHTLTLPNEEFCHGFRDTQTCLTCIAQTHPNKRVRSIARLPFMVKPVAKVLEAKLNFDKATKQWEHRKSDLQKLLETAKQVFFLSKTSLYFFEKYFKLDNSKYIPAGIAQHWFDHPPIKKPLHNNLRVGFLGAIAPHKGLHTLVEALTKVSDPTIELFIAGKKDQTKYTEETLTRYKQTTYLGELAETESIHFMDSIDLLVIPSNSPENQPQVLLEAAARGVPVIASDTPGCAELLPEQSTFPVNSADKLSALLKIAKVDIQKLGTPKKGISARTMANQICDVYMQNIF